MTLPTKGTGSHGQIDPALEGRIISWLREMGELHRRLERIAPPGAEGTTWQWVLDLEQAHEALTTLRAEARAILAELDASGASATMDPALRQQLGTMLSF